MRIVRVVILPSSFFVGVLLLFLIIAGVVNNGLASGINHLLEFIENHKLIICCVLAVAFAGIGGFFSVNSENEIARNDQKKAICLTALALIPNAPILKELACWLLEFLSAMSFTNSDVFSNAIMFLFMLPIVIFVGLIMVIVFGLFLCLTTFVPAFAINACIIKKNNIVLIIYMIIHMVVLSFLAIGCY